MVYKKTHILIAFLLALVICNTSMADILTLPQAEKIALGNARDMVAGSESRNKLYKQADFLDKESAPSLQFGADYPKDVLPSLPTNEFRTVMLGIEQPLPELHCQALRSLTALYLARAQQAKDIFAKAQARQAVRDLWLSLYESLYVQNYLQRQIVFLKHEKITAASTKQVAQLQQQLVHIKQQQYVLREKLSRYIGKLAFVASLPAHLPNWSPLPEQAVLEKQLLNNPLLQADSHFVRAGQQSLKLAAEQHNSKLNLSMGYGLDPTNNFANLETIDKSNLITFQLSIPLSIHSNMPNDRLIEKHVRQLEQDQQQQRQNFLVMKQALKEAYEDLQYFNNRVAVCKMQQFKTDKMRPEQDSLMQLNQNLTTKIDCLHAKVNRVKAQARVYYVLGK